MNNSIKPQDVPESSVPCNNGSTHNNLLRLESLLHSTECFIQTLIIELKPILPESVPEEPCEETALLQTDTPLASYIADKCYQLARIERAIKYLLNNVSI